MRKHRPSSMNEWLSWKKRPNFVIGQKAVFADKDKRHRVTVSEIFSENEILIHFENGTCYIASPTVLATLRENEEYEKLLKI